MGVVGAVLRVCVNRERQRGSHEESAGRKRGNQPGLAAAILVVGNPPARWLSCGDKTDVASDDVPVRGIRHRTVTYRWESGVSASELWTDRPWRSAWSTPPPAIIAVSGCPRKRGKLTPQFETTPREQRELVHHDRSGVARPDWWDAIRREEARLAGLVALLMFPPL